MGGGGRERLCAKVSSQFLSEVEGLLTGGGGGEVGRREKSERQKGDRRREPKL